jgi:tetratricopeptide (TPR) repeat protein
VKNESKIITRLLNSVFEIVDTYCICDTGSTDATIQIIEDFFKEKGIPGKIIVEPFQDFGYNRTFALKACDEMDADYILLLDADMVLWRNPKMSVIDLKRFFGGNDLLFIFQGSDSFYYKNTRVVRNKAGFSYKGVTHEYVDAPKNTSSGVLPKDLIFIKDIGDGGSKKDKFLRDIRLLKNGLMKEPNNERYMFYLANSLKDSNHKQEAIEYYQKRIDAGGWIEEVWYSYYNIGKILMELKEPEKAICAWMNGYHEFPNRIENLYEIVQHYRNEGKHKLAHIFYEIANTSRQTYCERDYLFMQKDIYDYKLDYEQSIFGYYYNPTGKDLALLSMTVLLDKCMEENIARNILSNYKFYSPSIGQSDTRAWEANELGSALRMIGSTIDIEDRFVSSTPTFCSHPSDSSQMYVLVRFVNYKIKEDGGYDCEEYIETINVLALLKKTKTWKIEKEKVLQYNKSFDNVYVGLEDVRLYCHQDKIYYNANRGLSRDNMVVEHGWINRISFQTEDGVHLKIDNQHSIEKNWVICPSNGTDITMVYNWYPIVIGKVTGTTFNITNRITTPYLFKHIRGSTNGVIVDDEIWFLCHVVSYEDRRYYYHVIVVLDKDSLALKAYTKLFRFFNNKVEYALGMQWMNDEFIIGYSVNDNTTKYMTISKQYFNDIMIR